MTTTLHEKLSARIHYDPVTGVFTWIKNRKTTLNGCRAGTNSPRGYRYIQMIEIGRTSEHRLAWFLMTGRWPRKDTDHINGDKSDNRWCNLREATRAQNMANVDLRSTNTSGFRGVYWLKDRKCWQARIEIGGKQKHIGMFRNKELAGAAVVAFAERHYGEFWKVQP